MANQVNKIKLTHDAYTIGWICALPQEQSAAIALLDKRHDELPKPPNDNNTYIPGSIGEHNIIIACPPKGRGNASSVAIVAARMAQMFPSIRFGLSVGIGSGIPPEVQLGDVVISTPVEQFPGVVEWDFGREEKRGRSTRTGSLSSPPNGLLTAVAMMETEHGLGGSKIPEYLDELGLKWPEQMPDSKERESLDGSLSWSFDFLWKAILHKLLQVIQIVRMCLIQWFPVDTRDSQIEEKIPTNKADSRQNRPESMRVHYGLIASGNRAIRNTKLRNRLNDHFGGKILCIDTQAAGVMNGLPCIVIRGICDYADLRDTKDWDEPAAAVAAACAKELLRYIQPVHVAGENSVKGTFFHVKLGVFSNQSLIVPAGAQSVLP